ncbi:MAG TPA: hypothetical protein DCY26_07945, partial [Hyphomonas sp.]|nr:hypothetical protein [Hyphomonas sp.]
MPDDRNAPLSVRPGLGDRLPVERRDEGLSAYPVADPRYSRDPYEQDGAGFDFWGAVRTLLRRKFMILSIMILGTAAAAFLTLREVPLYRATATIEIQRQETR